MSLFHKLVDLDQPWLYASVGTILFNPIFWNLVARNGQFSGLAYLYPVDPKAETTWKLIILRSAEYRNKSMTKIFGGAYRGTCVLAFIIFTLGLFRDWV